MTIKVSDFDAAILQVDTKREEFERVYFAVMGKLKDSASDANWQNAHREIFEGGIDQMEYISDRYVKNLFFLSNLLKQVQMDFEALDAELANGR